MRVKTVILIIFIGGKNDSLSSRLIKVDLSFFHLGFFFFLDKHVVRKGWYSVYSLWTVTRAGNQNFRWARPSNIFLVHCWRNSKLRSHWRDFKHSGARSVWGEKQNKQTNGKNESSTGLVVGSHWILVFAVIIFWCTLSSQVVSFLSFLKWIHFSHRTVKRSAFLSFILRPWSGLLD